MSRLCIYCLSQSGKKSEHIPAKCLITHRDIKRSITVPSCTKCNNGFSADEEGFRDDLMLLAGPDQTGETYKKFMKKMKYSSLKRNEIIKRIDHASGKVLIPATRTNRVLIKIGKGLLFHHTGEYVTANFEVDAYFQPTEAVRDIQRKAQIAGSLGSDEILYKGAIASDSPGTSIWWILFYKQIEGIVAFVPKPN